MRYFMDISYDGTPFHGWQTQPNAVTVEETIEKAMSILLQHETDIVGAGRTDTGVHARQMMAHFDCDTSLDTVQLKYKLNKMLPASIAINDIYHVSDDMHARFSAKERTYHYYIYTGKQPFLRDHAIQLNYPLDFPLMNKAAAILLDTRDFSAFCKSNTDVKTTLCNVTQCQWIEDGNGQWHFAITSNRFLRNMVRAIVGTIVDVGRHKITLDNFYKIINGGSRSDAGESMPAKALFLEKITY